MNTTVQQKINHEISNCTATIADWTSTDAQLGYAIRLKRRCEEAQIMLSECCDENDAWCYVQSGESKKAIQVACEVVADSLDTDTKYLPETIAEALREAGVISATLISRKLQCEVSQFMPLLRTENGVKHYGAGTYSDTAKVIAFLRNI